MEQPRARFDSNGKLRPWRRCLLATMLLLASASASGACSKKSMSDAGTPDGTAGSTAGTSAAGANGGGAGTSGSAAAAGKSSGSGTAGTTTQASGGTGGSGTSGTGASGSSGASGMLDEDGGMMDNGMTTPRAMQPIDPPVADDCIKDVKAGDHTYTCGGLTFLAMVDEMCTKFACGLIFDIHGATMSGAQMRDNTLLYKIAPSKGYIVVNPSATADITGGTWDLMANPPTVGDFMDRMIKAFHIDPDRVHVTGFSQGSAMTFWFLCNKHELLASAAPVSGATDVACLNDTWLPRVPILYENGTKDQASTIDRAKTMVDSIVSQLKLTGGMQIAGDAEYRRKHWSGDGGMEFDYIEHDYGGQPVLDGHCIPGGIDTPAMGKNNLVALGGINATTCTTGTITINWGQLVLQWFLDHPRKK